MNTTTTTTSNRKRSLYVYHDYRLNSKRIRVNDESIIDEGYIDTNLNITFEKLFQTVKNYNRQEENYDNDDGFVDYDDDANDDEDIETT